MKRRFFMDRRVLLSATIWALRRIATSPRRGRKKRITREVRHELLMLPFLGVFDNLAYKARTWPSVTSRDYVVRR